LNLTPKKFLQHSFHSKCIMPSPQFIITTWSYAL